MGRTANVSPSLPAVLTDGRGSQRWQAGECATSLHPRGRAAYGPEGPVRFGRFLLGSPLCAALASLAETLVGWKLCVAGSDLGLSAVASARNHA